MTLDLFAELDLQQPRKTENIAAQTFVLRGFSSSWLERLYPMLQATLEHAPFRHLNTPGGLKMSVATSCCGTLGWVSDQDGYRYSRFDPNTGLPWPPLPLLLLELATAAADAAGFAGFVPDSCLINRYLPDARMNLHQDKDERCYDAPIVSVSLGLPAIFLLGGHQRGDRSIRVPLFHGDVMVWGGVDRLRYHGVLPLAHGEHTELGSQRINLTLRRAG